jgi:hypothetical protein
VVDGTDYTGSSKFNHNMITTMTPLSTVTELDLQLVSKAQQVTEVSENLFL